MGEQSIMVTMLLFLLEAILGLLFLSAAILGFLVLLQAIRSLYRELTNKDGN